MEKQDKKIKWRIGWKFDIKSEKRLNRSSLKNEKVAHSLNKKLNGGTVESMV